MPGIVAEALPVAEEARRGWRSGQNLPALQAEANFGNRKRAVAGCPSAPAKKPPIIGGFSIMTTGSAGGLLCPCKGLLLAAADAALKRFANRIYFSRLR